MKGFVYRLNREADMSTTQWVTVKSKFCELIQEQAELQELRAYTTNDYLDTSSYRVLAERCSVDVACNLAGCSCKWAYTNPTVDQMEFV